MPMPQALKKSGALNFLGLTIHPVSSEGIHRFIEEVIAKGERAIIPHLNIHGVNLALRHPWLKAWINETQLVFCDGDGVRWGCRLLGLEPPPKITYDRWIWELARFSEGKGYTLFFLGSKPGVADQAQARLQEKYSRLHVVGADHGYFQKTGSENDAVIQKINRLKPDILIVGLGMPIQERWLLENSAKIDASIFLTGGAVFDYASGQARRAPAWMIQTHLEWLFRFSQEPCRLFSRYVLGIPLFFLHVFLYKGRRD